MWMSRMGRHSWLLAQLRSLPICSNFLANGKVKNDEGGNPEQEHQIFHRAPPQAYPSAGDPDFILGQQHETRKLSDHIEVCLETRG